MVSQKAWDETKAAILLKALIQVREGEVLRKDAISHNHLFKFMHKKQIGKMSVGIKHYIDYVKETACRKENGKYY